MSDDDKSEGYLALVFCVVVLIIWALAKVVEKADKSKD